MSKSLKSGTINALDLAVRSLLCTLQYFNFVRPCFLQEPGIVTEFADKLNEKKAQFELQLLLQALALSEKITHL